MPVKLYKLKSRDLFPPGGFKFVQAELNWDSTRAFPNQMLSFTNLVQAVRNLRLANKTKCTQLGIPLDTESIETEIDHYNARRLAELGLNHLVTEYTLDDINAHAQTPLQRPFYLPPEQLNQPNHDPKRANAAPAAETINLLFSGARAILKWIAQGAQAVPKKEANKRALTCLNCPYHSNEPLTEWFTKPATELIRKQLNWFKSRELVTDYDDKLEICTVCLCPLKLKVHLPADTVIANTHPQTLTKLKKLRTPDNCWIVQLIQQQSTSGQKQTQPTDTHGSHDSSPSSNHT